MGLHEVQGLSQTNQVNSLFAHHEVDYKSVLPGLDIVRTNPMITESAYSQNAILSAHNTGWFWEFETHMSNPWNASVATATLYRMGAVTILRSANSPIAGGNSENYARGLFYDLKFGGEFGATATLVDLQSDTTTTFQKTPHPYNGHHGWERLSSREFRDGTKIVYEYEGAQGICDNIRIRHVPSGAFVHVSRTLHPRACLPTVITLPDQTRKITYTYEDSPEGLPRLVQVTYPDGTNRKYTYQSIKQPPDEHGLVDVVSGLTSVIDEEGRFEVGFVWEGNRLKTRYVGPPSKPEVTFSVTKPASGTFTDGEGIARNVRITNWTNAAGVQFSRFSGVSSPCSWCPNDAKDIQYNDVGLVTQTTSQQGIVTDIVRNPKDLMQRETKRVVGAGTPEARTTTTEYDRRFNLPTKTVQSDASGSSVTTETTYNAQGRPTKVRVTNTTRTIAGTKEAITKEVKLSYTTHGNGQVATMTVDGPRSDVNDSVEYTYHATGLLHTVTNALGTTTYGNYDALGRAQSIQHPNGTTTKLTYNWRNQVLTSSTSGVEVRYTYYKNGLLRSETTPGTNETTTYTYDAGNRLQTATDELGNRRALSYDALGRLILSREFNTNRPDSMSRSVSSRYENAGRTVTTFPTDFGTHKRVETYNNDFQLIGIQDALSKSISFHIDALGRVAGFQNEANGLVNVATFDVSNNVRKSTYTGTEGSPRSQSFEFTSDATGAVWESRDRDTGLDTYARDLAGNVVDATNTQGGNRVQSSYDALNRITQATIVDPASGAELGTVNYSYDVNPDRSTPAPTGSLTQISGDFGLIKYFYDTKGNIAKKTQSHGGAEHSDSYARDNAGRIHTVTYPSGRQVHIKRNRIGQPTEIFTRTNANSPWETVADNISYAPFANEGNIRDMRLAGKLRATTLRDTAGRVVSYTDGNRTISVQYRPDGLISKLMSGGTALASYTYDASNRLKSASGNGFAPEQYVFESTGDLSSLNTNSLVYHDQSSKLASFAGSDIAYSNRGSVRSGGGLALTYDARGFLATARVDGGPQYRYEYDALGQRQSKTAQDGVATNYHYDLDGRLIAEFNPSTNETLREYVWVGDRPIMFIIPAKGNTPEKRYVIYTDYSNTPIRLTDTAGNTVWQWNRNPFGSNGPGVATVAFNLRMPGQYYDAETGLHYNGARYYVPQVGRYLQPDPLGEQAGISAYTYAGGDPVNFIDPTGLSAVVAGGTAYNHTLGSGFTVYSNYVVRVDGAFFSTAPWKPFADDGLPVALSDLTPAFEENNQLSSFLQASSTNNTNIFGVAVSQEALDALTTLAHLTVTGTRLSPYGRWVGLGKELLKYGIDYKKAAEAREDSLQRILQSASESVYSFSTLSAGGQAIRQQRAHGAFRSSLAPDDAAFQEIRAIYRAENTALEHRRDGSEVLYNLATGKGVVTRNGAFRGFVQRDF